MKLSKWLVGLAVLGSIGISSAYAAGLFPDFPIVGGATYCAGNTQSATGTITGVQTGCPNQVPAGPTALTGNEQIPADTRLSSGQVPQTVLVPIAALNALPITVSAANATPTVSANVSATNTSGGFFLNATQPISALQITLPSAPIDNQQYFVGSNRSVTIVTVTGANATSAIAPNTAPTAFTASLTLAQGYRFFFNAASGLWFRMN